MPLRASMYSMEYRRLSRSIAAKIDADPREIEWTADGKGEAVVNSLSSYRAILPHYRVHPRLYGMPLRASMYSMEYRRSWSNIAARIDADPRYFEWIADGNSLSAVLPLQSFKATAPRLTSHYELYNMPLCAFMYCMEYRRCDSFKGEAAVNPLSSYRAILAHY